MSGVRQLKAVLQCMMPGHSVRYSFCEGEELLMSWPWRLIYKSRIQRWGVFRVTGHRSACHLISRRLSFILESLTNLEACDSVTYHHGA